MTMLEKAARALHEIDAEAALVDANWDGLSDRLRGLYIKASRAVIAALREPDNGTVFRGVSRVKGATGSFAELGLVASSFEAVIDEILSDPPTEAKQ